MKTKNKILLALMIACIVIPCACFLSNLSSENRITDACVDPETGDLAIAHSDAERDRWIIEVFDANGNPLYTKALPCGSGGAISIRYDNSVLYVEVSREDQWYALDRDGNDISDSVEETMFYEQPWEGWEKSGRDRTVTLGKTTYTYRVSSFWSRIIGKGNYSVFIKSDGQKEVRVYNGND